MEEALRRWVRERALYRCEYCQLHAIQSVLPFQIDHVIPLKHGGVTEAGNLALSCFYCNSYKGANLSGIDPQTSQVVRLFHPRSDLWTDHFGWAGAQISGLSPTGRATARVLNINHPDAIAIRRSLIGEGVFPP